MNKEILELFPEDYAKEHDWIAVCDVCQIPYDAEKIVIEFIRTGEDEDNLKELKR